jgi:hypothetical protein
MDIFKVNFETKESIYKSFDQIATKISKDINLKINDAYYRIVDFEFYVYSEKFPDPHTYKNELQLQSSKLYLHGSGVDITCGDGINYCGILLRSIVKLYDGAQQENGFMKKQFDGPHVVATEFFSNLHPLGSFEKNEISIIDIKGHNQDSLFYPAKCILKTSRVGLSSKPNDENDFYKNLPLRYITILPKFSKFKQLIKGLEKILDEKLQAGEITVDAARNILGYNKVFDKSTS